MPLKRRYVVFVSTFVSDIYIRFWFISEYMYSQGHSHRSLKIAATPLLTLEQVWGKLKIIAVSTSGWSYFTTAVVAVIKAISRARLCEPVDYGTPLTHGSNTGIKPTSLPSPALADRFSSTSATWKALLGAWWKLFSFASWKGGKVALEEIKSLGNTFERKLGKKISRAVVIYNCEYIYIFWIYTYSQERLMSLKYPNPDSSETGFGRESFLELSKWILTCG